MLNPAASEILALALLASVLLVALRQPGGLPEAAVAVPAAGLTVLLGLVSPGRAVQRIAELGPTVGFLAAVLVLAHLADVEGVFRWLGERVGTASGAHPSRLFVLVFLAASAITAILSLDATVVLLTPVVLHTARNLAVRPRPHVYACAHLANSASLLLPVSNLTNLLAFAASGLSFPAFGLLMLLPWLAAVVTEYLLLGWFFRAELVGHQHEVRRFGDPPMPRTAIVVLGLTLLGFGLSGVIGVAPVWVAVVGAAAMTARPLIRRQVGALGLLRAASPLFCLFVLALGVVVTGLTSHGLGAGLARLIPAHPSLVGLFAVAVLAAVLANVVNNLPATLAMLGALGPGAHPGLVLAVLLGVNIGPNLSYVGSLATLLWRRVLAGAGIPPAPAEFTRLGLLTVPACLVTSVLALWSGLTVGRGWLR